MDSANLIRFECPSCNRRLRVPRQAARRKLSCPNPECGCPVLVPDEGNLEPEIEKVPEQANLEFPMIQITPETLSKHSRQPKVAETRRGAISWGSKSVRLCVCSFLAILVGSTIVFFYSRDREAVVGRSTNADTLGSMRDDQEKARIAEQRKGEREKARIAEQRKILEDRRRAATERERLALEKANREASERERREKAVPVLSAKSGPTLGLGDEDRKLLGVVKERYE